MNPQCECFMHPQFDCFQCVISVSIKDYHNRSSNVSYVDNCNHSHLTVNLVLIFRPSTGSCIKQSMRVSSWGNTLTARDSLKDINTTKITHGHKVGCCTIVL